MAKNRIDWVAELNFMIIDGENLKNQLFTLKNGKKIKSSLFHYGNGQVHGDTTDGKSFSFTIENLVKVEKLADAETESKKDWKPARKPRGLTVVGQIIESDEKGSTFENIINVGRAHLPR